ncbi:MAG: aminotransferase class III-fold pyridoxal phosphate-dependent enzyme, partial [Cyanobacteria bacterium K_DeepCast_35m_m1_288]|nr:aminotransferase class III-fold pyridoxal phosphate-dependent enzyme [Cyanobacteria bacterium K_DeepCast_35m_m1_288]
GVYIRPLGNVVYLLPPLCISDGQLQQSYSAIASGIQALTD